MKLIGLLRREEATAGELLALQLLYPGETFEFKGVYPKDYVEYAELCQRLKFDLILLTEERPIPSLAMERGFKHLFVNATTGTVYELVKLEAMFKPFRPEKPA